jgi:hypothetical protein
MDRYRRSAQLLQVFGDRHAPNVALSPYTIPDIPRRSETHFSPRFAPSANVHSHPLKRTRTVRFRGHSDSRRFVSAKTTKPILVSCDLYEDALIEASLDPAVCTIEPYSLRARNLAILVQQDGRFLLSVTTTGMHLDDSSPIRDGEPQTIPARVVTKEQLRSEPRFSNHQLVWSHRHRRVSTGLRFQIIETLRHGGPMTLGTLLSVLQLLGNSP